MSFLQVATQAASRQQFLLVADSDRESLSHTSAVLQKFHYQVWTTRTGAEALEMAGTAMPALVLAADNLNDMAILDFVRKLKQSTAKASLIILNGKKDRTEQIACLAAGAATCLVRPVPIEDLYRVVQVAIEPVPRMHLRINTKLPVSIKNKQVNCEDGGCARRISENGVYIRIPHPFPLKAKLPLELHLDDGPLAVEAAVIYTHRAGNTANLPPGMGMQFVRISEQDRERLRLFIRNQIHDGVAIL